MSNVLPATNLLLRWIGDRKQIWPLFFNTRSKAVLVSPFICDEQAYKINLSFPKEKKNQKIAV